MIFQMGSSMTRSPLCFAVALLSMLPDTSFAQESTISLKSPAAFEQQLREMGYAPEKFHLDPIGGVASGALHLDHETLAIVLGGCTLGKDCTYVVLAGHFSDVTGQKPEWVAKMNADYDLIKVWTNDDGYLAYAASAMVEGLPRATFRAWIERVTASTDDLGSEASKAGFATKK